MALQIDTAAAGITQSVEELEIDLLLEGVFRLFGHDFRGYRRQRIVERLHRLMREMGVSTVSGLQDRVMHDPVAADALLRGLSRRNAKFFDDSAFSHALRSKIVPWLRSWPTPKIWMAECVSAEEVYALAILLTEEGLYDKTQIFATAANEALLQDARQGGFAHEHMSGYEQNYQTSGGRRSLGDYCSTAGEIVQFSAALGAHITWAQHNLVTDASFNEFQLIVCQQALQDFEMPLRHRALQLFCDSLPVLGVLGVGGDDELESTPLFSRYQPLMKDVGMYRRVI